MIYDFLQEMALHISDHAAVKITSINASRESTYIVADFDGTLTQYFDDQGKSRPSIISVLRDEGILDEDYSQKAKAMHALYGPIEHDINLPIEERMATCVTWWTRHKELLIEKGLTQTDLLRAMQLGKIVERKGAHALVNRAEKNNIPFIIFSASGIGVDSIQMLMEYRGRSTKNISIVSNKLYRNDAGKMIGFSTPVIHGLNKKEEVITSSPEYTEIANHIKDKSCAIVIGDSVGDAQMVNDTDERTILRIGLCNDKKEERLPAYLQAFDIVITDDEGFGEITTLLHCTL